MTETVASGLHVAILLCAGIATLYLVVTVVQLMQLRQIKRRAASVNLCEPSVGQGISIEAELRRLNQELGQLRSALGATRNELRQLRSEQHAGSVTLRYNDAMAFAKRGFNAAGIATRCGISMSEAELVAALASKSSERQQPKPVNEHDEHQRLRAAA